MKKLGLIFIFYLSLFHINIEKEPHVYFLSDHFLSFVPKLTWPVALGGFLVNRRV